MAVAGMTGDSAHRSVSGGDELLDTFRQIAGSAASCSFVLAQDVVEARVTISVDGVEAAYGTDWDLRDDMRTVDLLGHGDTAAAFSRGERSFTHEKLD